MLMMSAYNAAPRTVGHLDAVLHMFAYLTVHNRSKIVLDDDYPDFPKVKKHDWKEFYPFAEDPLPDDMPRP